MRILGNEKSYQSRGPPLLVEDRRTGAEEALVRELALFLIVAVFSLLLMLVVVFGPLLCRTTFGGVWSSIVLDDCSGSFWSPTDPGFLSESMRNPEEFQGKYHV